MRSFLDYNSPFFRCFLLLNISDAVLLIAVILCDACFAVGFLVLARLISVVFSFLFWFCQVFWSINWPFSGCFLLLVTSHAVLIAAILCDACLVLACLVLVIFHFLSDSANFFGL